MPAAPETVAAYLAAAADRGLKAGSVQRRVSSIAAMHQAAGFESPTGKAAVHLTLAGMRRALGTHQQWRALKTGGRARNLLIVGAGAEVNPF
jgi:hypothetical protein